MEEFVSLGSWWLPQEPQNKVPGKLVFASETGAKLELYSSFYDYDSLIIKTGNFIDASDIPLELRGESHREGDDPPKRHELIELVDPEEAVILGQLESGQEIRVSARKKSP
jgi:hypothetical protein